MRFLILKRSILLLLAGLAACGSPSPEKDKSGGEKPSAPVLTRGEVALHGSTYPTLAGNHLIWLGKNLDLETEDSWCYDGLQENCAAHGRLYRWAAAQEACRQLGAGWRLPKEEEWRDLATTFGGYQDWLTEDPEGDAVLANRALGVHGKSGFEAGLGGWRGSNGGFDSKEKVGFFWTATPVDSETAWFFVVNPIGGKLTRRQGNPRMGMSCRCVRDR